MPAFVFETIARDGRRARGSEHAASADALTRALEARGLFVLDVRAQEEAQHAAGALAASVVADGVRALASLLAAGMPLARALEVVADTAPASFAGVLRDVRGRVERGESVAAACAAHPEAFSATAVGVVRAGERAGDLDSAFDRLAGQMERASALRSRLLSAALYPAVLAVAGSAAVVTLLVWVLPRFADLLLSSGMPVPRSTALLLSFARALRDHWMVMPAVAVAVAALVVWLARTTTGRRTWACLLLALPLVGRLRRDALAAETARSLGVLLRGGTPIATAVAHAADSARDVVLADALRGARERIVTGGTLHAALSADDTFSAVLVALVATGEESGRLTDFLERAAQLFEERTERALQRLVALAEPAMIVIFGVVIGLIALSLLQAIYGINPVGMR